MIERQFIAQKTKEYYIRKYVEQTLGNVGISSIKLKKIPLGEKLVIYTSRPSLIVGSKGANIRALTRVLKKEFNLENPQIEIEEVQNPFLDANIVAEKIVSSLERFGSARFKGIGHKMLENILSAGALGVEIIISGKIPGARAKSWRFYMGYLKKCGDIAVSGVRKAKKSALLKSGIIGVKVAIMPADLKLPDHITLLDEPQQVVEAIEEEKPKKKPVRKRKKKESAEVKESKGAEIKEDRSAEVKEGEGVKGDNKEGKKPRRKKEKAGKKAEELLPELAESESVEPEKEDAKKDAEAVSGQTAAAEGKIEKAVEETAAEETSAEAVKKDAVESREENKGDKNEH